ncbi:hypothetical protein VPH35_115959 [Triticum aestivum]|uniref:vacuolar protein sorting-associated protein 24 homolog 1 n=1 Tax=Triticum aestivum TaxID=4565 RepID=UPI000842C718|nr:vacuolar protein sorting-associated protein 24 homolog 1-like [Triticum aestivum]XP_044418730.1 vacuolar protein sorting-associated protein 24 homolog 1-like [Triticum aestivum]XP_044418731.1 vacuolar protein sorting-associated protein 24 homolog 1-like [Triticum aestivum]
MEVVKSLLKPKPTPQQQLREWQRRLRNEGRNIERQIQDVQKEEKKVEKAIRDAAKALAKELVQSRKVVNQLYENKDQLNSMSMHLGKIVGCCDRRPEQQDPHEDPAEVDVGQEDHQALVHVARSCSSPRLALMKNTSAFIANNTRMLHN